MTDQPARVPTEDLTKIADLAARMAEIELVVNDLIGGYKEQRALEYAQLVNHIGAAVANAVHAATQALEERGVAEILAINARFEELHTLITDVDQKHAQASAE